LPYRAGRTQNSDTFNFHKNSVQRIVLLFL
jgi:hypothetical protein